MCWVAAIPLAAAAVSGATSIYSSRQQKKAAEAAANAERDAAKAPGTQQAKAPDASAMADAAGMGDNASTGSAVNTLLTGAGGVDPNNLQLGRNTLGGSVLGANSLLGA